MSDILQAIVLAAALITACVLVALIWEAVLETRVSNRMLAKFKKVDKPKGTQD